MASTRTLPTPAWNGSWARADFAAELGYRWSYQSRYHCPAYFDRHVLGLTISKDLNLHHVPPAAPGLKTWAT